MSMHLQVVGGLCLGLVAIHPFFPWYFHWKRELPRLSLINRQMMVSHTFFLAVFLLLSGLLCLFYSDSLVGTALGHTICGGLGLFWLLRFGFQWLYYSRRLWRGKPFETLVHFLFSGLWIYFTSVFTIVFFLG